MLDVKINGFHVTSSPPCLWTKTKDLSLSSFVRLPEVVHFTIVTGFPRGWLKTWTWVRSLGALVAEWVEGHPTGVTEVMGSNPAEDFRFKVVLNFPVQSN